MGAWRDCRAGRRRIYRSNKQSYRATYDLAPKVTEPEALGGQPMLVGEELMGAVEAVNALPEIADALKRRDAPSGYGFFRREQPAATSVTLPTRLTTD